jgi:hypothetical protein
MHWNRPRALRAQRRRQRGLCEICEQWGAKQNKKKEKRSPCQFTHNLPHKRPLRCKLCKPGRTLIRSFLNGKKRLLPFFLKKEYEMNSLARIFCFLPPGCLHENRGQKKTYLLTSGPRRNRPDEVRATREISTASQRERTWLRGRFRKTGTLQRHFFFSLATTAIFFLFKNLNYFLFVLILLILLIFAFILPPHSILDSCCC